ncbi:hypothetical protein CAP35_06410 [Chitinophagaceae bacterium IBVUCB1]|nr:hypothetical protein CAP35_06410 [Chitinophagaceae bacterium IBVUCB1]
MLRLLITILCLLPLSVYAGKLDTVTVKRNGFVFEIVKQEADTLITMQQHTMVRVKELVKHADIPITINGVQIYNATNSTGFQANAARNLINERIHSVFNNLKDELPAGNYAYQLPDVVVNTDGKIVYYTADALSVSKDILLTEEQYKKITAAFDDALRDAELIPLIIDGEKQPFLINAGAAIRTAH